MAKIESATLTGRIEPGLEDAIGVAAAGARRSVSNRVEELKRDYCTHNGIDSPVLGGKAWARRSNKAVEH